MTTLTLCMIVRDESDLLPEFLNSVQGLYDELCVLDTGSTDDSVRILTEAGAKVYHAAWENDFAKARNTCLQHATGDWVIFLDADEMANEELCLSAREVLKDQSAGAATLAVHNTLPNANSAATFLLRMFRRDPSIQFEHAIHEDLTDSLLPYLKRTGLSIVALRGHVEHLGYVRERADARNKKERDCGILQTVVAENPDDLYSWFKLLEQARFWEDSQLLADTAPAALEALERAPAALVKHLHFAGEMLTIIAAGLYPESHKPALLFLYPDSPKDALDFLEPWEERIAASAAYFLRRGELRELVGGDELGSAAQDFDTCLGLRGQTSNTQLASVRPLVGLARVALGLEETHEALKFLNLALGQNPRDPEALLALATLSRSLGGETGLRDVADAYVQTYGDAPELHGALGEAALRAGDAEAAVSQLQLAVGGQTASSPYSGLLDEALMASI